MSWRRCSPAHEIASAAVVAASRGRREVRPAPDDRQDPPAGRPHRAVGVAARPGVEDERAGGGRVVEAVDRVARARRVRVAGRREDDRRRPRPAASAGGRRRGARRPSPRAARRAPPRAAAARARRRAAAGSPASRGRRTGRCTRAGPGRRRSASGRRRGRRGTGVPRRASSARIGRWKASSERLGLVVGQVGERAVGAHAAGVRAGVAVDAAACGRAPPAGRPRRGRRRARSGSPRARRAAPRRRPAGDRRAGATPRARHRTARRSPGRLVERVADRHALAGGQAVGLDHDPAAASRQVARERDRRGRGRRTRRPGPSGRRPRRRSRGRTPCSTRSGPPPADGPKTAIPAARERVGDAGRQRRLGPDRRRARPPRAAPPRRPRAGSSGSTPATPRTRGSAAIASLPGATTTSLTPGSAASFQASACSRPPPPTMRMRVGRDQRLMPAAPPGRRIGRQARSIVCVRSGPTDTRTIGTPACSSRAVT